MSNEQTIVLPRIKEKVLIVFILGVSVVLLPAVIHSQAITGPIINMLLILAVFLVGPVEAVFLGLLPSVFALSSGLLPLSLAPTVPFVMVSNAILIGVYYYSGRKNFSASVILAGLLKFSFLYGTSRLLLNVWLVGKIASSAMAMMGWMQFLTAVIGGVLAGVVLELMGRMRGET